MVTELNEDVLENALAQLPKLRSLHVVSCPKADHNVVLRVVRYTPDLQNLSFSTSVSPVPFLLLFSYIYLFYKGSKQVQCAPRIRAHLAQKSDD
jgi:hypothetical protein